MEFLVNVDDEHKIDGLLATVQIAGRTRLNSWRRRVRTAWTVSCPRNSRCRGPAVKAFRVANYPHNSDQVTTKRVDDLASNSYTSVKRPGVSPAPFGHKRRAKLVGLRRLCLIKNTYEIHIGFDINLRLDL